MHKAMINSSIVSALQPDEPIDRGKEVRSSHIYHKIMALMEVDIETDGQSRIELDSHANIPVVGREALVVEQSGRMVEVSPFTPDYKPIKVEVVNAIIQYDSPLDGKEYIIVAQNALRVPSMSNNLLPPFIMRENGIMVNECAKIHCEDPTRHDHAIIFKGYDLCIPLRLHGVFSYFVTRKPDVELALDMNEPSIYAKEIYTLTLTKWNPHTDAYALNEESIVDWEGNIKEKGHSAVKIMLNEIGDEYQSCYEVSTMEALHMDKVIQSRSQCNNTNIFNMNELSMISSVLCPYRFTSMVEARTNLGSDAINIGATNCYNEDYLDNNDDELPMTSDMVQNTIDRLGNEEDMNAFFSSGVHGGPEVGVDARHLSKVWRISYEDAKRTIDATTQYGTHTPSPVMNQNYTTNDRMLRYKQITQYFFMDTLFATKKGGTSSRGNACCQLFVTDKGFIYVVPMKCKSEVLAAIKLFAKEVGAPDAIVSDMAKEQVSQDVRNFCNTICTTLRALEEGTPWSNKAELYIKLMKEAVCKDMKESNCPLRFWDYCLERRVRIYNLTSHDHIKVRGSNPHMETFGEQGDISNLCQFRWYQWCYFRDHKAPFPTTKKCLVVFLAPPEGKVMNYHNGY